MAGVWLIPGAVCKLFSFLTNKTSTLTLTVDLSQEEKL
jgi:hypothetical protein